MTGRARGKLEERRTPFCSVCKVEKAEKKFRDGWKCFACAIVDWNKKFEEKK